ncbi:hypothetical protein SK803_15275 [Lentzea sp. BCCO 10_0856]|uniref:Lipoprotein n=1 Tax=Lentzea miocenica TaxID=3095431 RepID=A0ABU4T0A7_9PSEU|nr:hypothetical protein [Lentzea sp. BCCO 10_0856]MDX8031586.1 hypothetical protein [Lentzea sp. BCCO 10_0856]
MTLSACGVRPTPVLTGAEAPTVSSHELTVYLISAEQNGLVRRTRAYSGTVETATAINLLVAGLTDEEKKLGLQTEVPTTSSRIYAVSNVVLLPEDMPPLSKWAQFQLYCTAIASRAKVEGVQVSDIDCP